MSSTSSKSKRPAASLAGVPRGPLNEREQAEAVRRTQRQAEQRVKLGVELFKAADGRLRAQSDLLEQIRGEQKNLREKVREEVAASLSGYDQRMEEIDQTVTGALGALEARVDALAQEWSQTRGRLEAMMKRSEALLDQGRMLSSARRGGSSAAERPSDSGDAEPLKFPGGVRPPESAAAEVEAGARPVDEQVYSLILEKLRHDESDRSA